jgi:hypothetical protein
MKWGWLFRTYVQWHAVAFLLSELCVRTKGEAVERAWRALEATAGRWWFPLNQDSQNRSGRPHGCLWNPLRKLLAKAKAAREKELALERASIALRNGQLMYSGFPQGIDQMSLPPLSMDQPSSENLDRMLRPSAPRLGESPTVSPPTTWPQSPLPNAHRDFSNGLGSEPTESQIDKYAEINGVPRKRASPVQNFTDLTNFGLDNVLHDVMDGMDVQGNLLDMNGNPTYDFPTQRDMDSPRNLANPSISQIPMSTSGTQPNTVNRTATALNAAHGTFGDEMFGNVDFGSMPTPPAPNGTNGQLNGINGQLNESPLMEGGNMDWTMWDDMVTQYGLEGAQANPNSNPASHMGLVHWF